MLFNKITMLDYSRPIRARLEARKSCGPYTWQPTEPGKGRGFYCASGRKHSVACDPRGSTFDLRLMFANDTADISSRLKNTTGYYCDDFQDQTMQPIIALLPHKRGYLAGWTMGAGMCASLDGTIWPNTREAALAAHDLAEHDAEKERDYQAEQSRDENEDETDGDAALEARHAAELDQIRNSDT